MKVSLEKRVAKIEAVCQKMRSEEPDVQQSALDAAVLTKDEELAAALARVIRDRLLKETDFRLALDRCGLSLPENITATSMLTAVKSLFDGLRGLVNGDWAKYRQALRDVPQQSGFPFSVTWPTAPDAANHEED